MLLVMKLTYLPLKFLLQVTLVQAIFRGLPWRKVPIYITAQLLGATVGALLLYANYYHAIDLYEGGGGTRSISTASLLATYALDYMPNSACFFSEFLGTAFLVISVLVLTDESNGPPPKGLVPLGLFFMLFCQGASLGMETSYGLNPVSFVPYIITKKRGSDEAE